MDDHHSEAVVGFGSAPVAKLGSLVTFTEEGGSGYDPDRTHRFGGSRRASKTGGSRKAKVKSKVTTDWDIDNEDVASNFGRPPVSAVGVKGVLEAKRTRSSPHIQEYYTAASSY